LKLNIRKEKEMMGLSSSDLATLSIVKLDVFGFHVVKKMSLLKSIS